MPAHPDTSSSSIPPKRGGGEGGGTITESSMNSAEGSAAQMAQGGDAVYARTFGCDLTQIFSPIQIKKDPTQASNNLPSMKSSATNTSESGSFTHRSTTGQGLGGAVPYGEDLDPYFSLVGSNGDNLIKDQDAGTVVNEDDDNPDDPELDMHKAQNITEVRTVGIKGPALMSGWGFDMADKPVPSKSSGPWMNNPDFNDSEAISPDNPYSIPDPNYSKGDTFLFSEKLSGDRSKWKSGPIHLLWDEERQVWSGGLPMLMGVATSDVVAPEDPTSPTEFTIEILRHRSREILFDEETNACSSAEDCPEGFTCNNTTGYCEQETVTPFMPLPGTPEEVTLKNFDPSMSQKLVTRNRERTALDPDWPDVNCADVSDCNNANLSGPSKCEDNKCVEIPPGAHNWLDNPSLVWVLAIKMNYVWIPFYIGCPPECLTSEHCVSLYKDDPNFEELPGVDSPANWECSDGECVFSGAQIGNCYGIVLQML